MARTRTLRPQFFSSFNLAKVSRDARLFFAGLWVEADDEGRLIDSPKQLAGAVFPHDDDVDAPMVVGWLDDLIAIDVVQRYDASGGRYLLITNFAEHQKPPHASPSKLPQPSDKRVSRSRVTREKGVRVSRKRSEDTPPDERGPSDVLSENAPLGLGLNVVGSCLGSCSLDDSGKPPESVGTFAAFWDAYPLKVDKPTAERAWKKIKPGDVVAVMAGLARWNAHWNAHPGFTPYPSKWLNGTRWNDPTPSQVNGDPEDRDAGIREYLAEDASR